PIYLLTHHRGEPGAVPPAPRRGGPAGAPSRLHQRVSRLPGGAAGARAGVRGRGDRRPDVAVLPAHGDAAGVRPDPVVPPALGPGRAPDDVRAARPAAA